MDLPVDQLRASGMRSTPQRRAILATFLGGTAEHLSADEVYARAESSMPGLGRGTVYATLAEFCEADLIAAVGSSEPVRYEANVSPHAHFRCRMCLRIYDVDAPAPAVAPFAAAGHRVEGFDLRAEGVCAACRDFGDGLDAGVRALERAGAPAGLDEPGVGAVAVETPLGRTLIAASAAGLLRVGWDEHGDARRIRALIGRAGPAAQQHLTRAAEQLQTYFAPTGAGTTLDAVCAGSGSAEGVATLRALQAIPSGKQRPYHQLESDLSPRDLGSLLGSNPLAILWPCHRVTCGATIPGAFIGGPDRRRWLLAHEAGEARH